MIGIHCVDFSKLSTSKSEKQQRSFYVFLLFADEVLKVRVNKNLKISIMHLGRFT